MTRRLMLLAAALVVLVNAIVLAGVARNRGGEPESVLELTERELTQPWRYNEENSGVSLELEVNNPYRSDTVSTIPEESLRDIGFSLEGPMVLARAGDPNSGYLKTISRKSLAVLELEGESWKQWLAAWEATESENRWPRDPNTVSRLFLIDVGRDAAALRARYPDTHRYAIVQAQTWLDRWHRDGRIHGYAQPLTRTLHVPRQLHARLGPHQDDAGAAQPFSARVRFGRRLEPWIESIQ
jgi:hypothetical protein